MTQPGYKFRVVYGSEVMPFEEISLLDHVMEPIDYREAGHDSTVRKLPTQKLHSLVLKNVLVDADNSEFLAWCAACQAQEYKGIQLTITHHDEEGNPVMAWNVAQAIPTAIEYPGLPWAQRIILTKLVILHEGLMAAG